MLTLYKPEYEDLWFRQMMLADEDTMSYNHAWGGTIDFPEERWRKWYERWVEQPDGKPVHSFRKRKHTICPSQRPNPGTDAFLV